MYSLRGQYKAGMHVQWESDESAVRSGPASERDDQQVILLLILLLILLVILLILEKFLSRIWQNMIRYPLHIHI